ADAAQSHLRRGKGVGRPGGVPALTGTFHQAAHRIAHKSKHIHKHSGSRRETLFRRAAHQFHSGGSSHGGSYAHLGLTTAHSTRHSGVAHGKITHSTCVKKRICYFFITEI